MLVSDAMQYIPLGKFAVSECQQGEDSTVVTGYDAAYYGMGIDYVPAVPSGATVAAVLDDVAGQCGLAVAALPGVASTTPVEGDLTGHTCREMAGLVAALVGCNALIDRNGALALRWFADSGYVASTDDYYAGELSLNGSYTLACIACVVTTEITNTDEEGTTSETEESQTLTAGGTGSGISIENPYMTQTILDAVWLKIGGLAYKTGSVSVAGGLLLEPGDLIAVTDRAGASHMIPIMSLSLTVDGGCKAAVSATGESSTTSGANVTGGLSSAINQVAADVARFKDLIVTDVNGTTKINGGRIDTNSLFAQDITATGTISGLKLRGSEIDIDATGESGAAVIETRLREETGEYLLGISAGSGHNVGHIELSQSGINIYGVQLRICVDNLELDVPCATTTYTTFDGDVVSSGSVVVVKKLGWCQVFGVASLTGTVANWTTILDSSAVPAPQHGKAIYQTVTGWGASYARPARVRISPGGGLMVRYGAAFELNFSFAYPIE